MRNTTNRKADELLQNVPSSSIPPFNADDPESMLDYIGSIIHSTSNLAESYAVLKHLGLNDKKIAEVIKGGCAYIYGEVSVPHKSRLHVQCGIASVSIKKESLSGNSIVYLDDVPLEQYVRRKMKAKKDTAEYLASHTKEELFRRIQSLEKDVARPGDSMHFSERRCDDLTKLVDLATSKLGK